MKAEVRKEIERLFSKLPRSKKVRRLEEEFERKGFLSRKELKVLDTLKVAAVKEGKA